MSADNFANEATAKSALRARPARLRLLQGKKAEQKNASAVSPSTFRGGRRNEQRKGYLRDV